MYKQYLKEDNKCLRIYEVQQIESMLLMLRLRYLTIQGEKEGEQVVIAPPRIVFDIKEKDWTKWICKERWDSIPNNTFFTIREPWIIENIAKREKEIRFKLFKGEHVASQ